MHNREFTIATLLVLAACTAAADPAPAPGEPAAASSAGPAETAGTESETALPALTAEGWGPLTIGMTLEDVIAAAGPDAEPEAVGGPEPEYCDQFRPARAPEGLYVMIEQGVLTRISVTAPAGIETDSGLSVGDSAAAVRSAYGDALHAQPHTYLEPPAEYLTVWTVGDPGDRPYTDDPAARGIRFETDERKIVERIHAGSPSIQYVEGCL